MIVVISDLHLQHTSLDVIRRREGERVLETRITRNVSAAALSLLFSEIVDRAARVRPSTVHLVFAGDIFELHRTPLWFSGGETLRPTLHPAAASEALEGKVHAILDAIEADNRRFFEVLAEVRRPEAGRLGGAEVIVHYLPGNHDRLINAWPSTRRRARKLLCVEDARADAPFGHELEWTKGAGYGVRVRHGHEYDTANFAAAFDPANFASDAAYTRPCLGDFVTVDIALRLAVAFRAHYARELRVEGARGEAYRRVYAALTEFDDVRPQSMLIHYLTDAVGATENETFAMLRPVLRDAFETAAADSFFVSEAERLELGKYFKGGLARVIDGALATLPGDQIGELIALFERFRLESNHGGPASVAARERGIATGEIALVIAGHTHEPDHVALPVPNAPGSPRAEAYYLDSGTWRTRIDAGVAGAFGRLRAYTMVFAYHDDELRAGESRRFETWTGHLQAEDNGPVLSAELASSERPPAQSARFLECRVQHIDEGETHDGAELVLWFGVDGVGQKLGFDGVRDGAILTLPASAVVSADPSLDGEIWCWALERDRGDSLLDHDDALPWAVTFIPRARSEKGGFEPGLLELRAADNRGNAFTLLVEVL